MAGLDPAILFVPPHQGVSGDWGDPSIGTALVPALAPFARALRLLRTYSQNEREDDPKPAFLQLG